MSGLYGAVGGVNREIKKLYGSVNGVNREIKELWATKDGVNRKIFSAYDCKGQNLRTLFGELQSDGSITSKGTLYTGTNSTIILFKLIFENPISFSANNIFVTITNSYFYCDGDSQSDIWVLDASQNKITEPIYLVPNVQRTLSLSASSSGSSNEFYLVFLSTADDHGQSFRAPPSCITLGGHKINNVELI